MRKLGAEFFPIFGLLAANLYWASLSYVGYAPLGLLQVGLVMFCPLLLWQRPSITLGVVFLLFSLLLGFGLAQVDRQPLVGQRAALYLYAHLVWLLVLLRFVLITMDAALFRAVALVFIGLLSVINVGDIAANQQAIALLEGGVFLVGLSVFGRLMLPSPWLLGWLLGVVGVLCVANSLAVWDGVGLASWWRVIETCMHLILGWSLFVWGRSDPLAALWVAGGIVLAVLVYVLVLVGVWVELDDPGSYDWFLHPPLFRHIRHLGYFLSVGFVASAWLVLVARGWFRPLVWLAYVVITAVLLWSGSRGAFIACLVGVASLLVLGAGRGVGGRWVGVGAGLAMAFGLSSLFPVDHPGLGWMSAFARSGGAASLDGLSTGRLEIWSYLWGFVIQRPWFGWGGEGVLAVWDGRLLTQAHNVFLQLLVEWGVVGLVAIGLPLLILLMVGVRRCWFAPAESQLLAGFGFALVVALMSLSLVDGVFYHGLPSAMLALGCALLFAASHRV